MKIHDSQSKFIVINQQANSLYSLIADGQYRKTSLGRDTWKSLIGSEASLQYNCNMEGFNAYGKHLDHSKVRIGILGNNENDCDLCDSRIGFGTGGKHDNNNACGNEATYKGDNNDKHIKCHGIHLGAVTRNHHGRKFVEVFLVSRPHSISPSFLSQQAFHYDNAFWSNNKTFNLDGGKTGLESQEN